MIKMRLVFLFLSAILGAAQGPERTVLFARHALDGAGNDLGSVVVTIVDGKIGAVTPATKAPEGARDLGDATLLPGLIDTHVHISWHFTAAGRLHTDKDGESPERAALEMAANAWATLRAGFTTIQSVGAPEDVELRDAINRGEIPGPRILTAIDPFDDATLTPNQMREKVRTLAKEGADLVKIFASKSIREGGDPTMSQEQMDAICGQAKESGLRTLVHAHSAEAMKRATLAGCSQIEHGIFATDEVLKLMASRGVFFDPQCSLIFRNYFDNRDKYIGIDNYTDAGFAAMKSAMPLAIETLHRAFRTPHLNVVFGTDAVAGAHGKNAEDLVCRIEQGGQKPMDAITSATSLAARSLNLGDRIGRLAAGYEADLVALDGDPVKDPSALLRPVFVMRAGRVYRDRN